MEKYAENLASVMRHYGKFKNQKLYGRYITQTDIAPILEKLSSYLEIKEIGKSVKGEPIHIIDLGKGKTRVLAWSQMHGNESTTTKALFDLLEAIIHLKDDLVLRQILDKCSIRIIPMLNPDGARAYKRSNANDTDLNRDAQDLKEVESRLLRGQFEDFQPDFGFNLHDQRTIFSAGDKPKPATLSFLTPARDKERTITADRQKSMQVIFSVYKDLQKTLPGQIGRYDDAFNINCAGDSFQSLGVPTLLFEAGHFQGDYEREETREFVFAALMSALKAIANKDFKNQDYRSYFEIPENEKLFNDIILRNAQIEGERLDVAVQFQEKLEDGKVIFQPVIAQIAPEISRFGHREITCEGQKLDVVGGKKLAENVLVNEIRLKDTVLALKYE